MKANFEDFLESLKNEISVLLKSESQSTKNRFRDLIDLDDTLKNVEIPQEYFNVKYHYLNDFKNYLSSHNRAGDDSFIRVINERATQINTYLINTEKEKNTSKSTKIETEDIYDINNQFSELKNEYEDLKNKIKFSRHSMLKLILFLMK